MYYGNKNVYKQILSHVRKNIFDSSFQPFVEKISTLESIKYIKYFSNTDNQKQFTHVYYIFIFHGVF